MFALLFVLCLVFVLGFVRDSYARVRVFVFFCYRSCACVCPWVLSLVNEVRFHLTSEQYSLLRRHGCCS